MLVLLYGCSSARRMESIRTGKVSMALSVPEDKPDEENDRQIVIDSIRGSMTDGPIIMNAIRDEESGEMVATDIIRASSVSARFRNVAERDGQVSIEFDITVPPEMSDSKWQLKVWPKIQTSSKVQPLEPVYITGREYRQMQLRGYQRYRNFVASIVSDTADFVKINQLEIFLCRNFPQVYAMKTDSSFVNESTAKDVFGVSYDEVVRHYRRHLKMWINGRREARKEQMFKKYVKDPIPDAGVRLDTVFASDGGMFTYRYRHSFRCQPKLRKAIVSLEGGLFEDGQMKFSIPFVDSLTYYISSLSSLYDNSPKYIYRVIERTVYDNTKALLDFRQGSSEIDTLLSDNASELRRVKKCIDDVVARSDLSLDSLVIVASCSPEGTVNSNIELSMARSRAVRDYIEDYVPEGWKENIRIASVPENWEQFGKLVKSDTLLPAGAKKEIQALFKNVEDQDRRERLLSALPQYRYLREKIYPKLRSVGFNFYMHRTGMQKDTTHKTELDTIYMSGLSALENLDYKEAVRLLRPYRDYNSALALMAAGYNHTALDVMEGLDGDDPRVCYLRAVILARLGMEEDAARYLELSIALQPSMEHRANLDPELYEIVQNRNKLKKDYYE